MGNNSGVATTSTIEKLKQLFIHPTKHECEPAENGSRQQNEFLHTVLESLTHPFYVVDADDYTIRLANSAAGFGELDATSTCYAFTHRSDKPCSGAECPCPLEIVKKTKKHAEVEHTHYDEDGSARVYTVHCHPVFDERGEVAEVVEYSIDITERKRAQEVVRESEERFRQVAKHIPEVFWIGSPDWRELFYVSPAYEQVIDLPCDSLYAQPLSWLDMVMNEDREKVTAAIARISAGDFSGPRAVEFRIARPDGSIRWIRARAFPILNEHGEPYRIAGTAENITERRKLEEEREALARFTSEDPSPVLRIDRDGTLMYINKAGRPLLNTLGCDVEQSVPDDWQQLVSSVLGSGSVERIEFVHEDRTFALRFAPVVNAGYVNVYGVDVTYRKQAEEEKSLLEAQLRQAQKMEAVGTLAGGMAHEFNNILTGIVGYVSLAQQGAGKGSRYEYNLRQARSLCDRAEDLIKSLLAFGRKRVLQASVTDVNALVESTLKMLKPMLGEDIKLGHKPASEKVCARVDAGQIQQAVVNLAVNARDAMPVGGNLNIDVDTAQVRPYETGMAAGLKPGEYVTISVADTGCGMDEATIERIFEPFFTTKEPGKGTGLGLSMVHGVVQQHEGRIVVDSEIGKGTTFTIYLPTCDVEEAEVAEQETLREGAARGSGTVLVVDDDAAVRAIAEETLEQAGYTVFTTGSVREAEQTFAQHSESIELLLSDVVMPDHDGPTLYHRLTASNPSLKVLYMSGYPSVILARHGIRETSNVFLAKPFDPDTLVRRVQEILSG